MSLPLVLLAHTYAEFVHSGYSCIRMAHLALLLVVDVHTPFLEDRVWWPNVSVYIIFCRNWWSGVMPCDMMTK